MLVVWYLKWGELNGVIIVCSLRDGGYYARVLEF